MKAIIVAVYLIALLLVLPTCNAFRGRPSTRYRTAATISSANSIRPKSARMIPLLFVTSGEQADAVQNENGSGSSNVDDEEGEKGETSIESSFSGTRVNGESAPNDVVESARPTPSDNGASSSTKDEKVATSTSPSTPISLSPLQETIDRMSKPRAYPLFLAEKAAEFLESTLEDVLVPPPTLPYYAGASSSDDTSSTKQKIVVLGSGWGAAPFLQEIDASTNDVTVISPRDYFLFTPMLAGASVGTVEFKSITEPVSDLNPDARYIEAMATEIDPSAKTVRCQSTTKASSSNAETKTFDISYDKLIVSIGARSNTFDIPGVTDHCFFLRQVEDARRIRNYVRKCFEKAAATPSTDGNRRKQLLSFVIIGGGPTGVEFSAELGDFIDQDASKVYPELIQHVNIKIVDSSSVLSMFDKQLQEDAVTQISKRPTNEGGDGGGGARRKPTEVLLGSSVKEVRDDAVVLADETELPYGMAIWAAGNGPLPLTVKLIDSLGETQSRIQNKARGRLGVDAWMRVVGTDGSIVALGDCSYYAVGDGDSEQPLPATAQVASQQGEYLAKLINKGYNWSPEVTQDGTLPPPTKEQQENKDLNSLLDINNIPRLSDLIASIATETTDSEQDYAKPFQYLNLGILTYTGGGTALSQISLAPSVTENIRITGPVGNGIWRSVYWAKQVSWRNRLLLLNDWSKKPLEGRDVSRL